MARKIKSSVALAAKINGSQNQARYRRAFNDGFAKAPIWDDVNTFTVSNTTMQKYEIEPRFQEIVTNQPELVSCGADIPMVGETDQFKEDYYVPTHQRLGLDMCKDRCDEETFESELEAKELKVGAGFGQLFERVFWSGSNPKESGIAKNPATLYFDASGTTWEDLHTKGAIDIANYFYNLSLGMESPRFRMGSMTKELVGWREQSSEQCSEVWGCVIKSLASRFNESEASTSARFLNDAHFDYVTGIDSNNPADTHAGIMVTDRRYIEMGASRVELSEAMPNGHDIAEAYRSMYVTSPLVKREGAVRFAFGFVPHGDVDALKGQRYLGGRTPSLTIPA